MKYNLSNEGEIAEARAYLMLLTGQKQIVEIKKVNPKRSLNQNSYLHLLIGAFALATGNTLRDSKYLYKWVNQEIYYRKKKMGAEIFTTVRSSADLDKEEMAKSIDRFIEWSKEKGYPLPPATDQGWLMSIQNELERNQYYL